MESKQNIVLITIDSLRADKTGVTDGESFTPNLDQLAESGVLYENATAPGPSTYESMPSIWTGELMAEVDVEGSTALDRMAKRKNTHMKSYTIPERLRDLGYETGAFTANPHTSRNSDFSRGFQDFEDYLGDGVHPLWEWVGKRPFISKAKHLLTVVRRDRVAQPWTSYTDGIKSWLDDAKSPFFLWIFILEPHTPYLPRSQNRRTSWPKMIWNNMRYWSGTDGRIPLNSQELMKLYEDAVRDADDFIGWLNNHIPDGTAVVVHSDHGEGFGNLDHGQWGHKGELYDENVHVPLIINDTKNSGLVTEPVSLTSLFDILVDLAKDEYRPGRYSQEYTVSRTFRPNRIGIRTQSLNYWATLNDDAIVYENLMKRKDGEEKDIDEEFINKQIRTLVRRRNTHEREVGAIRHASESVTTDMNL